MKLKDKNNIYLRRKRVESVGFFIKKKKLKNKDK